jgi:putative ABC transport system permease protein
MSPSIVLAIRQLKRSPLRTVLAAFAVASGVATLIAADVISLSVTAEINRTAESEAITGFMGEQLNVSLTAIGLVISVGAGFLLFNSLSMSITQRRGEFGRLRAIGMTRIQLASMILFEALVLGLIGSGLGILAGLAVGHGLIQLLEATSEIFNQFGQATVSSERMILAAILGSAVSLCAAFSPALQVARMSPVDALRLTSPTGIESRSIKWTLLGILCGTALWTYLSLYPPGNWALAQTANRLAVLLAILWFACVVMLLPGLIEFLGWAARVILARASTGISWMAGDNIRRARGRTGLSILTLTIAIGMIVAVSGFLTYWFDELFFRTPAQSLKERPAIGLFPIDVEQGLAAYGAVTSFSMPEDFRQEVEVRVGSYGTIVEAYFVLAPELSFLGDSYFSYILRLDDLRNSGDLLFSFSYGDWDRALVLAEEGCVVFVTPGVAQRNEAWLEQMITIQTPSGALDCTIAGIGPTFVGASIISASALTNYHLQTPVNVVVFPRNEADRAAILPELQSLADATPGVWLMDVARMTEIQQEGMKSVGVAMDGLLLLAVIAAALGIVNMTIITIMERRRELGVLRAVGATREQLRRLITIEGFLTGILGSTLGTILGIGLVLLYVVTSAGSPMGFPEFPVWTAAWNSARPALGPGLIAILTTPWLTALSARIPARRMLDETVVGMLGQRGGMT